MSKNDLLKKFGWVEVPLDNFWTHFHIKEVTEEYVLLEDKCPKDKKRYGSGDIFKKVIDLKDPDEIEFRENCKKIMKWSKQHRKCPEVHIHLELGVRLMELY